MGAAAGGCQESSCAAAAHPDKLLEETKFDSATYDDEPCPMKAGPCVHAHATGSSPSRSPMRQTTRQWLLTKVRKVITAGSEEGPQGGDLGWLNWLLERMWPFLEKAIVKAIKEQLEPKMQAALPTPLNSIQFKELALGRSPPKLGPIDVFKDRQNGYDGLIMQVGLKWSCKDENIKVFLELGGIRVGIDNIAVEGTLQISLRPLLEKLPILGGIQITMLSPPKLSWNFNGMLKGLQMDIISRTLRKVVADSLSSVLVFPNQVFVHWLEGMALELDLDTLQFPKPEAVLRLCVKEARSLRGGDWSFFSSMGTSDPYAMVQVGTRVFQTPTNKTTLFPVWDKEGWHDYLVFNPSQSVKVDIFDEDWDPIKDDHLGFVDNLTVKDLLDRPDGWWDLKPRAEDRDQLAKAGTEPQTYGQVRLVAHFYSLRSSFAATSIPQGLGKADDQAFAFVVLRSCRGIIASECTGAKAYVRWEGKELVSKASTFKAASEDDAIPPATQKMVEHLHETTSLEEIVEISGLTKREVTAILYSRPSFTMRWGESITLGIQDLQNASIDLMLDLPGTSGKCYAELETSLTTRHLMEAKDWVIDKSFLMKPDVSRSGGQVLHDAPVEVNARISLRALSSEPDSSTSHLVFEK